MTTGNEGTLTEEVRSAYLAIKAQPPWKHPAAPIVHHRVLPFATYAPWLDDEPFMATYEAVRQHTLVDIYRCYELWTLAQQAADIDGDFLEVGVWRGGTGCLLAEAVRRSSRKTVYLADSFSGVVKAGENDTYYKGGEHADTSVEIVSELARSMALSNVHILPGIFPDETDHDVSGKIAMLHCDVDVYASTRDIVEWALPRLSPGSILVFDDYGFYGCEGVTRYCNEFRRQKGFRFIHNLNGHAIFVKIK